MPKIGSMLVVSLVALRKESVDRNSTGPVSLMVIITSLSARRAWIEIVISAMTSQISVVALRKESVDRNSRRLIHHQLMYVALRKESVDRNLMIVCVLCVSLTSLSARRAWIEISSAETGKTSNADVALRKESVDRNSCWLLA